MRSGDVKLAFTYYEACTLKSAHEPVYWLNLSAAYLKLKMYVRLLACATVILIVDIAGMTGLRELRRPHWTVMAITLQKPCSGVPKRVGTWVSSKRLNKVHLCEMPYSRTP